MRRDIPQPRTKTYGKLETESPLSPYRAFVVQFRTETDVARGQVRGRVEHVVSGQATHFASLEELLTFIGQVLETVRAPPRRRAKEGKPREGQGTRVSRLAGLSRNLRRSYLWQRGDKRTARSSTTGGSCWCQGSGSPCMLPRS